MKQKGFRFQGQVREYGYLRYMMAMASDGVLLELFQVDSQKAPSEHQQVLRRSFSLFNLAPESG